MIGVQVPGGRWVNMIASWLAHALVCGVAGFLARDLGVVTVGAYLGRELEQHRFEGTPTAFALTDRIGDVLFGALGGIIGVIVRGSLTPGGHHG